MGQCIFFIYFPHAFPSNSAPNPDTESPTPDLKTPEGNATVSLKQKEEQALMKAKMLANAVHYIWETGEDKYMLRYFHTGFWLSCEKHHSGEGKRVGFFHF